METKSTTSSDQSKTATLAEGIKNDREEDTRGCPHEGCHGHLTLTEDENRVVCSGCRCTPDGVYLPLPESKHAITYVASRRNPEGLWGGNTVRDGWELVFRRGHDTYDNRYQDVPRLAGGYEAVYDQDERGRPHGVSDAYTWDLSSSNYEKVNTGHEWTNG
mgnify:CR=1 FL=1